MQKTEQQNCDGELADDLVLPVSDHCVSAEECEEIRERTADFHRYLWRRGILNETKDGKRVVSWTLHSCKGATEMVRVLFDMAKVGFVAGIFDVEIYINKPEFDYKSYLQSDEWKATRDAARERAGRRCQVCNAAGPILDTHHRTYERIGEELPGDLIVLCRYCHDVFHEHRKLARPQ